MGGGASKASRKPADAKPEDNGGGLIDQHVTAKVKHIEQTAPRKTEENEGEITLNVRGVTKKLPFAYFTQAGYYPNALGKANQDALYVKGNCGDKDNKLAFFGVFDGHGKQGEHCSDFAKRAVCASMESDDEFRNGNYYRALVNAHVKANKEMHEQEDIGNFSDMLSGTTSITALIHQDTIFVANVGDSRAISIMRVPNQTEKAHSKLMASPLSIDQTPFRGDERIRVKKRGARVMTMAQLEGYADPDIQDYGREEDNDGDPPRLWHPAGKYPGTAFTRSLGDRLAEEIGVCAVPEVLERSLSEFDQYLLLASDGVFEFITSEGVVSIFERFQSDLLGACRAIVAEAYRQWLQFEVRTDDISVIIVDLRDIHDRQEASSDSNLTSLVPMSVLKRTGTGSIPILADELHTQFTEKAGKKTSEQDEQTSLRIVSGGTKKNSYRAKASSKNSEKSESEGERSERSFRLDQSGAAEGAISPLHVDRGGAAGIKEDQDVWKKAKLQMRPVRRKVSEHVGVVSFDPAALEGYELPNFPKSAENTKAIQLGLQSNYLFVHLDETQMANAINAMREVCAEPGDIVIQQFDKGDCFYVASSGRYVVEVAVPKTYDDGFGKMIPIDGQFEDPRQVMEYSCEHGVYPSFGELALMYNRPRAATIRCIEAGQLWALERMAFHSIVGRDSAHHLIKILRKVDALRDLSYNEVARLVDVLVEVEFKPGEHIVQQGEKGNEFFILKKGTAVVTINDPDSPSGKEVMQLAEYDYFGERALINSAPRAANVIARDHVTCLVIRKPRFDEILGRLQDALTVDGQRREDIAEAFLKVSSLGDLRIFRDEIPFHSGQLYKCKLKKFDEEGNKKGEFGKGQATLRRIQLPEQEDSRRETERLLENDLEILRRIAQPCFITSFAHPSNPLLRYQLFRDALVSDLKTIITDRPLDPGSNMLKYCMRTISSALVQLHQNRGVLCRMVTPEAIFLDLSGKLILSDFRYAKLTGGARTFTACGTPDYMSPEQVKGTGHSFESDFWALGVLLVELYLGKSPWSDMTEVQIYECVTNPISVQMIVKGLCTELEQPMAKLLTGLLKTEPERRTVFSSEDDIEATPFFQRVRTKHSPFAGLVAQIAKGTFFDTSSQDVLKLGPSSEEEKS